MIAPALPYFSRLAAPGHSGRKIGAPGPSGWRGGRDQHAVEDQRPRNMYEAGPRPHRGESCRAVADRPARGARPRSIPTTARSPTTRCTGAMPSSMRARPPGWPRRSGARGIGLGDTVSAMLPNVPAIAGGAFRCVPMTGARAQRAQYPARCRQHRLHAAAFRGPRFLLTDREFSGVIAKALATLERKPLVIDVDDPAAHGRRTARRDRVRGLHRERRSGFRPGSRPTDEWQSICLNYTSGTTGNPKGRRLQPPRPPI